MERLRGWLAWLRRIAPERWLLVVLLVLAAGIWIGAWHHLPRPLEVVAFSVGDGDAYLIRIPSGRTVLWDGGSRSVTDVGERVLVPNLMLLGVRRLDAIVITHADSDHVNGLPAVMETLPVGMLLDPEQPSEDTAYQQVVELAKELGIPRHRARAGHRLNLGGGTHLTLLAPGERWITGTASDTNNNGVVGLLEHGQTRMLFTGDLEREGERLLLARDLDLQAQVITVAHHGSRNGTSDDLLDATTPYIGVISSHGSRTGTHPHPEVLQRLRARGLKILRTDVHGQIRLTSDGVQWRVQTHRKAAVD